MAENIVYLHGRPREVAQVARIGFFDHRQAEHLWSANKLHPRRFIVEASNFDRQTGLLRTLRDAGAEVVLDTNAAELSVPGRFSGAVKSAPWAVENRMLEADDFVAGTNRSVIEPIARFAVAKGVQAVMAPTHFLDDRNQDWLPIDLRASEALRLALDREGGADIEIDYPLIVTMSQLRDASFRASILEGLTDLPKGYIWLRASGFGADATGTGMSRYIEAVRSLHELGRPIIADQVGGIAGLAICAFGAVSGFSHGIEGKQRFNAGDWLKPPKRGGGGRAKRIFLPGLDRSLEVGEAKAWFDEARTARQIFGCPDTSCCGDIEKMLGNPEAHFMVQRSRSVNTLSSIPESVRTDRFLEEQLEQRMKEAQRATRLKKTSEPIRKKIENAAKRLERTNDAHRGLHKREGQREFAMEATLRPPSGKVTQSNLSGRPT